MEVNCCLKFLSCEDVVGATGNIAVAVHRVPRDLDC